MKLAEKWTLVLDAWLERVKKEEEDQIRAAKRNGRFFYGIGIPMSILAAGTGSAAVVELTITSTAAKWVVAVFGIAVAVLSGVQNFCNFGAASQKHFDCAKRCGKLVAFLEYHKTFAPRSEQQARSLMGNIFSLFNDMHEKSAIVLATGLPQEEVNLKDVVNTTANEAGVKRLAGLGVQLLDQALTLTPTDSEEDD